jgi:hypothetical protein
VWPWASILGLQSLLPPLQTPQGFKEPRSWPTDKATHTAKHCTNIRYISLNIWYWETNVWTPHVYVPITLHPPFLCPSQFKGKKPSIFLLSKYTN